MSKTENSSYPAYFNPTYFARGQAVKYGEFDGVIAGHYSEGMWEVRLPGGTSCVSGASLTPSSSAGHPDLAEPIRTMVCCCCGASTKGRQFFNQDTGYALGDCCVDYVAKRTQDMQRTYGVPGVHYRITQQGKDVPENT